MKKGLLGLSAFIFAAALVGCGADKEKTADNNDQSETTTIVGETSTDEATTDTEENTNKKDKDDDSKKAEKEEDGEKAAEPVSIKDIAGTYTKDGHAYMGKYPDDIDELDDKLKEDPVTISEDGILHFCGKDYKLTEDGVKGENNIFGVEGSGLDISKFSISSCKADKDYEGPCAFVKSVSHMTVNDQDYPYVSYLLFLKQKGAERCFGYISLNNGEDNDITWNFTLDEDSDGSVFDDNTTEE